MHLTKYLKSPLWLITLSLFLLPRLAEAQSAGDLDASFNYGRGSNYQFNYGYGANSTVNSIAIQSDDKILIGGSFTTYNGASINRFARLNSDGSLDNSFNTGTGANFTVSSIALQSDGKILIGGSFTSYNGTTTNRIARLNADGSLDDSFNPGTGANSNVFSIALQSDGKILIGGLFTAYNGTTRNRIARLNADGTIDNSFNPGTGANSAVNTIALLSDNNILIGGQFTTYNGTARNRIARLNSDGTLDNNFIIGIGANNIVNSIALQSDGKILIGGFFASYNGTSRSRIARLYTDGSLDNSFNPGTNATNTVNSIALQSDGKILIGVVFSTFNGTPRNCLTQLNIDGSLDASFNTGTGANATVNSIILLSDGKIIIGGQFISYNGIARTSLALLNSDGSLENNFNPGTGASSDINSIAVQSDGKILIGGGFITYNGAAINSIALLNTDGSTDNSFNLAGAGANGSVSSIALQTNGQILIGGSFTTYNGNALNRIARLNSNGSLDNGFNTGTGANSSIFIIKLQSDGKILIGGNFTTYNGTSINYIARLNSTGILDNSFNVGTIAGTSISSIELQSDGKILIAGDFTSINGTSRNSIARLNSDGSIDNSFNTESGASSSVNSMALLSDGKILIGGNFTTFNGNAINRIARLNSDGSLDDSFNLAGTGAGSTVNSIVPLSDGSFLIGGAFSTYNGNTVNRLARLNSDGSLDNSFNPAGTGASSTVKYITLQTDGTFLIGGAFSTYNNLTTYGVCRIFGVCSIETPSITVSSIASYCSGGSLTLTSSATSGNHWSNGATTQSITVTSPDSYTVQVINGTCISSVSPTTVVPVASIPNVPTISAGSSTTLCAGGAIILTSTTANNYLWSTRETTQSIIVTSAGSYTVQAINGICTSASSSPLVITSTNATTPTISASGVTTFCDYRSVILTSSSATGNLWSTGATTRSIEVTNTGSYTVSNVVGLCTSPASTATNVTVYPSPTRPEISPSGTITVISGNSQVLTAPSGYDGYIWSNGATTQTISVSVPGSYTVNVVSASGCLSDVSDPTIISISIAQTTWNGTSWSNGTPDRTMDAFVNGNLTVLSSFSANSFTVISGTVTLAADVTLHGNLNTFNNSVIGGANIILGGISAQSIAGNFTNLKLANSAGASLSSDVNVRGILALALGTLNINNQGLTFVATATSNGTVDDFSTGYTGSISGYYSYQLYFNGNGVFTQRFVSAPVTGLSCFSPSRRFLTQYEYSESANAFVYNQNCSSNTPFPVGNSKLLVAHSQDFRSFNGGNSTGTVSFPLMRTNLPSTTSIQYGFNSLGNPYPSAIDWTLVKNISGNTAISNLTAWVLRGGQWATITSAGVATLGLSKNIGPGIGFLVRRSTVTGTANLVFNNSIRTNASPVYYRSATAPEQVKLTLSSTATEIKDEAVIYSDVAASTNNDDLDAPKLFSPEPTAPSIYVIGEESQSIAALPMLTEAGRIVKVAVNAQVAGTYTLDAEVAAMPFGLNVQIEDATTHTFLPSNVAFNMKQGETKEFNLHFTKAGMGTTSLNVYPNPAKDQFFVNIASPIVLQVLNTLGQVVITQTIDANTAINTASLPAGVYTLKAEGFKATSLVVSK